MNDIERVELAVRRTAQIWYNRDTQLSQLFDDLATQLVEQIQSKAECTKSST